MLSKLRNRSQGFTIIEVLIVLAIAGLIMVIVFLAVPALQRNSRNTQRDSDGARVLAAVNNWVSNNNGAIFTAGTANANLTAVVNDVGTLGQYTLTAGTNFTVTALASGTQAAIANTTDIRVVTSASCGQNGVANYSTNTRNLVIQYAGEGGNGTVVAKCIGN